MSAFIAVIPARYASTRLPGKPLIDLGGKPMVVRVAERAAASGALRVVVATDHEAVAGAVRSHGFEVCLTGEHHPSGTDRIAEVVKRLGIPEENIVVNVQGDEPLIPPQLVAEVAACLVQSREAVMATVCHPIESAAEMFNPNVVKLVTDKAGYALYFSRAPIPWARDAFAQVVGAPASLPEGLPVYRHIGLYAYRAGFLATYARLESADIERFESLEQLRVLWHGYRIAVAVTRYAPPGGVDTPEDALRVRAQFDRVQD